MEQEIVLKLFDRYADMVYRIALSYLRSPQEAEDVVAERLGDTVEVAMGTYSHLYPDKKQGMDNGASRELRLELLLVLERAVDAVNLADGNMTAIRVVTIKATSLCDNVRVDLLVGQRKAVAGGFSGRSIQVIREAYEVRMKNHTFIEDIRGMV